MEKYPLVNSSISNERSIHNAPFRQALSFRQKISFHRNSTELRWKLPILNDHTKAAPIRESDRQPIASEPQRYPRYPQQIPKFGKNSRNLKKIRYLGKGKIGRKVTMHKKMLEIISKLHSKFRNLKNSRFKKKLI